MFIYQVTTLGFRMMNDIIISGMRNSINYKVTNQSLIILVCHYLNTVHFVMYTITYRFFKLIYPVRKK